MLSISLSLPYWSPHPSSSDGDPRQERPAEPGEARRVKRGRECNVAAIQSLEDFNAINILIGAPCVFVMPQTHLCSRPTAAFLRRVDSPPRSLQPTAVISQWPRQPASKLRGSAASTFAQEHASCKMEREKKRKILCSAQSIAGLAEPSANTTQR